ncbi:MAG: bifunctional [glutamate--ammonia ligase]-adenylyl-L-tyrosine phosphorylase/[glutamate--ammonia-ligase] adenylyltransferase [Halieaceae bacterium]
MESLPLPEDAVLAQQQQRVLAASKFASTLCQREPGLLEELHASGDFQRSYAEDELAALLRARLSDCESTEDLSRCLRQFRRREMLRILWRDFTRLAPTMETTRDTSLLAEACIGQALDFCHQQLVDVHGEPRDRDGRGQRLLVIAMGKLGARELNLSSDVDLIFTYPEQGQTDGERRPLSNQEFFLKLGQRLIGALDKVTAEGFVFRVDMRLRPYGESGALVLNFSAMEEYYQDQGRDWERYALIKARVIAGDPLAGRDLMLSLRPFVYRRYIDFGAIDSLRAMKEMINAEVRRRGLQADVKLGPGGIREIEFIVQCFQLIRGGRSDALRQVELLKVLHALPDEGCMPESAVAELEQAYLFLRDTEHAIQGYLDQQSQSLPGDPEARAALLLAMDFSDWESFAKVLDGHRARVSAHFADLIATPEAPAQAQTELSVWPEAIEATALAELGFDDSDAVAAALTELRDSSRLRHLQAEGRARLDQFMPRLLAACAAQADNSRLLLRLLPMVQAVARRSAYLMLLLENPAAFDELLLLGAASPWISEQLAKNPVLLDELLDTASLYSAPDRDLLRQGLRQQMSRLAPDDLEANMEALRYFKASQQLHVAASEVTGRLPLMQVSDKLTFLAEVILEQALQMAWQDLTAKHGLPQREQGGELVPVGTAGLADSGFAVLGYGKLGGIELGHGSDLDLVFVYDSATRGATNGERPLDSPVFYTRLGQRIIHILDARTAMGQLYEVDMRLRPSGESGMLVASYKAFEDYQLNSAWTWEHQALVRARVIAGDQTLGEDCEKLRQTVLTQARDEADLRAEVVKMRQKMRSHLLSPRAEEDGEFHLKQGLGGIVDIEFMVQYAVLAWSNRCADLTAWTDNIRILETLHRHELFTEQESQALIEAYISYRSAAHQLALQQRPDVVDSARFDEQRRAVSAKWRDLLGE